MTSYWDRITAWAGWAVGCVLIGYETSAGTDRPWVYAVAGGLMGKWVTQIVDRVHDLQPSHPHEVGLTRLLDYVAPAPNKGWIATTLAVEREAGLVFDNFGGRCMMWPGYWEWKLHPTLSGHVSVKKWLVRPLGSTKDAWVDPQEMTYSEAIEALSKAEKECPHFDGRLALRVANVDKLHIHGCSATNNISTWGLQPGRQICTLCGTLDGPRSKEDWPAGGMAPPIDPQTGFPYGSNDPRAR